MKRTFVDNLANIIDLFKTYDDYISRLKKLKLLNGKIEIQTATKPVEMDPVRDVDKIRRLRGFQMLVKALGDLAHSDMVVDTPLEKYALNETDRKNIRIVGLSPNLVCWATKGYETTNKFIYQIWRNDKTLGRGDVYGDPSEQTPYCTHSIEHWKSYSNGDPDYQQFWFFERLDNPKSFAKCAKKGPGKIPNFRELAAGLHYKLGDLNDLDVVKIFNHMPHTQATLVCQNDTMGDLLDRDDRRTDFDDLPYGNEVRQILTRYFKDYKDRIPNTVNIEGYDFDIISGASDARQIYVKTDTVSDENTIVNSYLEKSSLMVMDNPKIRSLDGAPEKLETLFLSNLKNLQSLGTFSSASKMVAAYHCPKLLDFSKIDTPVIDLAANGDIPLSKLKFPKLDKLNAKGYVLDGTLDLSGIKKLILTDCSGSFDVNLTKPAMIKVSNTYNKDNPAVINGNSIPDDGSLILSLDGDWFERWTFDGFPVNAWIKSYFTFKELSKYLCWKTLTTNAARIPEAFRKYWKDYDEYIPRMTEITEEWRDLHTYSNSRFAPRVSDASFNLYNIFTEKINVKNSKDETRSFYRNFMRAVLYTMYDTNTAPCSTYDETMRNDFIDNMFES